MRIAISGASGFIGRQVLRAALAGKDGPAIVALTRSRSRLAEWKDRLEIVELDIGSAGPGTYDALGRPDVLLHLAWEGLPNYSSLHHFTEELPRQYRFLETLIQEGLPALVGVGTCFEFGLQTGALAEDTLPRPVTPYGFAKAALAQELGFLRRQRPFRLTWARLFYMFGEGQPATSLYPLLRQAVERGDPTFNMSGGEQLRDYLPIKEVGDLLFELARQAPDTGPVHICSGRPVSVRRLVESWLATWGRTIHLNLGHYPYPDYEPMAFWGMRDRLDALLKSPEEA